MPKNEGAADPKPEGLPAKRLKILADLERERHTRALDDLNRRFTTAIGHLDAVSRANEAHYRERLKIAQAMETQTLKPAPPIPLPPPLPPSGALPDTLFQKATAPRAAKKGPVRGKTPKRKQRR